MTGVLIIGEIWTQTRTRGEGHVDVKAEMGRCVYEPENTQDHHQKPGHGPGTDSPSEGTKRLTP